MDKSMELKKKAESYDSKKAYWESMSNKIDLSMPESIEYFEFKLEEAKMHHEGLKNGTIKKEHSYSLTYAKKAVNEMKKNYDLSLKLWGNNCKHLNVNRQDGLDECMDCGTKNY
jgi:hypothetical protein